MRRIHLAAVGTFVLAAAGAIGAGPAAAEETGPARSAVIESIDGPGLLSVRDGRRVLKVRLPGIDSPLAGECGADAATAALGAMAAPGRRVSYRVARSRGADPRRPRAVRPVRDLGGRLIADVHPERRPSLRFGPRLISAGWAKPGWRTDGDDHPLRGGWAAAQATADLGDLDAFMAYAADAGAGLWGLCSGRFHLPTTIGADLPALPAPAAWTIARDGGLRAIGDLDLTEGAPLLAPGAAGAMRTRLPGAELTTDGRVCLMVSPTLGVTFTTAGDAYDPHTDCDRTTVVFVTTFRLGAPTSRGPAIGDTVAAFMAAYPNSVTAGSGDVVSSMSLGTGSGKHGGVGTTFDPAYERVVSLAAGFFEFQFG